MNDLIDRYLAAVARELPEGERADIAAELRDELMSGVESKEDELGRPLERRELEAELIAFGNPLLVAGRYRRVQHLIGPQMYPFWWAAMRATLVVIAAIYAILIVLGLILGRGHVSGLDVPEPLNVVVFAFGAVTGVCALVERYGRLEWFARWRPERLPPAQGKRASRFELLTELGMGAVFLLWWTGAIHVRDIAPDVGLSIDMGPFRATWFWWILGYSIVDIGSSFVALVRPDRVGLVRWMIVWRSLLGAAILVGVFQAGPFLIVSGPAAPAQESIELGLRLGLGVAIALFLLRAGAEVWRVRQDGVVGATAPGRATVAEDL